MPFAAPGMAFCSSSTIGIAPSARRQHARDRRVAADPDHQAGPELGAAARARSPHAARQRGRTPDGTARPPRRRGAAAPGADGACEAGGGHDARLDARSGVPTNTTSPARADAAPRRARAPGRGARRSRRPRSGRSSRAHAAHPDLARQREQHPDLASATMHGRPAVGQERQRQALRRQQAEHHRRRSAAPARRSAIVVMPNASSAREASACRRAMRNPRAATSGEERQHDERAEQPELLADHREDEVGVRLGQVEHLLLALPRGRRRRGRRAEGDEATARAGSRSPSGSLSESRKTDHAASAVRLGDDRDGRERRHGRERASSTEMQRPRAAPRTA